MTRDEAVARAQVSLGFRTDKVPEIINALQDAQLEAERGPDLPWWLVTEVASRDTVIDEERIPLPTDFLREYEGGALWYFNGSATDDRDKWRELIKETVDELRVTFPGEGTPCAYALDECYFRIFPTPDAIYTLKMRYYKRAAVLSSNIENDWLKHEPFLLIGKAGQRVAEGLRDQTAVQVFQQQELEAFQRMLRETRAREDANSNYVMGGPD